MKILCAPVKLAKMRLGQGIGGKAYFVFCGLLEDVEASLEAASDSLKELDSLVRVDCIPRPEERAFDHF